MPEWLKRSLILLAGLTAGGFVGYRMGRNDTLEKVEKTLNPLLEELTGRIGDNPTEPAKSDD